MKKFVIEREIPGAGQMSTADLKAVSQKSCSVLRELGPEIRVNGVSPGAILWPEQAQSSDDQTRILNRTPLARCGEPADIARAVHFLLALAPYITGQIIAVDGGRSTSM